MKTRYSRSALELPQCILHYTTLRYPLEKVDHEVRRFLSNVLFSEFYEESHSVSFLL